MQEDKTGASVKFPPPLAFFLTILVAYGIHQIWPLEVGSYTAVFYVGVVFAAVGLAIALSAVIGLRKARTSVEPWKPTSSILQSGIYGYSRNPIYAAFSIVTIGIGCILNSLWIILSLLPGSLVVYLIAIKKEEQYLAAKFGDEYLAYKSKVRRWI
jgi:protein-S-isoprenylcysteine O-methyltransferase Ste14